MFFVIPIVKLLCLGAWHVVVRPTEYQPRHRRPCTFFFFRSGARNSLVSKGVSNLFPPLLVLTSIPLFWLDVYQSRPRSHKMHLVFVFLVRGLPLSLGLGSLTVLAASSRTCSPFERRLLLGCAFWTPPVLQASRSVTSKTGPWRTTACAAWTG